MSLYTVSVIKCPPSDYLHWLDCFELISTRRLSSEDIEKLKKGTCSDHRSSIDYLENELVKAINKMLLLCINDFKREINLYYSFGDNDSIYAAYRRLANRFEDCLFFNELTFLSEQFRKQLNASVCSEIDRFWDSYTQALYNQCIESNSRVLEDQLYYIRKLRAARK